MATGTLEIKVPEGTCECGCGTIVKRRFAQGHDARLRGILGKAFKAEQSVRFSINGKSETMTADKALKTHGFPIPVAPKPKAPRKAKASTVKPKTAKRSSAKAKTVRKPRAKATKAAAA